MRWRVLVGGALLAAAACDEGFYVDPDEYCRRRPSDAACVGAAGAAGASGSGGSGASGTAGTSGTAGSLMGSAGVGGGGSGGGGPCANDAACPEDGSLCVGDACTEPAASCTKATLVVVPDEAFAGTIDGELAKACHYRELDAAFTIAQGGGTTRVAVYAAAVEGPVTVPGGVRLEGRPTAPATLVALTPGAGGASGSGGGGGAAGAGGGGSTPVLVTLDAGAALTGFALDGKGSAGGVKAEAGAVRLEGPLTVTNATRALDLGGTVDATVTGTQAAPVRLSANGRGIVVGATAKLTLTGDGDKGGVTVEGTTAGAGVLVLAGGATAEVRLEGLLAKDNMASAADGTGAVEIRQGRSVTVKGGVFEGNRQAVTLNGELTSGFTSFTNVVLEGNLFTLATPGQGSVICGSKLGSQTELNLGPGNVFPLAMTTCPPVQVDSCNSGADVGHDTANAFAIVCGGT